VIDLNRFRLYDQLHARAPNTTTEERATNQMLVPLLLSDPTASISYQHPGDTSLDVTLRTTKLNDPPPLTGLRTGRDVEGCG
jgi:hypothetical protein